VTQGHADESVDKFANNLFKRVLMRWHHADLDDAMLDKPSQLAIPSRSMMPLQAHPNSQLVRLPGTMTSQRGGSGRGKLQSEGHEWRGPRPLWAESADTGADGPQVPTSSQAALLEVALREAQKKDPEMKAKMDEMQKAMATPEVQREIKQIANIANDPNMMEKIRSLKEDADLAPVLKEMEDTLKKEGPGAIAKFMNDEKLLSKFSAKMGPPPTPPPGSVPARDPGQAEVEVEINDILDAAKYGDLEALEDFLDLGKSPNEVDKEKRTPLHFVAGGGHVPLLFPLISNGADLDALDSMSNTPLHYAAGFGRTEIVAGLLDAGASISSKNANGNTAADLAKKNSENPVFKDADLLKRLEGGDR